MTHLNKTVQVVVGSEVYTIVLAHIEYTVRDATGLSIGFTSGKRLRLMKDAAKDFIRQTTPAH